MARSRIKSEEEYNKILGVGSSKNEREEKTTHDASQYFDELRGVQEDVDKPNPFERVVSVDQIRRQISEDRPVQDIEKIKEQIASSQKPSSADYSGEVMDESIVRPNFDDDKRVFSFEDNARRLYENLRVSRFNQQPVIAEPKPDIVSTSPASITENRADYVLPPQVEEVPEDTIPVVEVIPEREMPKPLPPVEIIPEVSQVREEMPVQEAVMPSLEEQLANISKADLDPADDALELTADFTMENNSFIDAINQESSEQAPIVNLPPQEEVFVEEAVVAPIEPEVVPVEAGEDDFDFTQQLNEQMNELETEPEAVEEPQVEEQPEFVNPFTQFQQEQATNEPSLAEALGEEPNVEQEMPQADVANGDLNLDSLKKNKPREDLNHTLTLALNQNESVSMTQDELRELKSGEMATEKPVKRKASETIMTIAIVIMIAVVLFLLAQTLFFGQ